MDISYLLLFVGIIIGALIVYPLLSRKILARADEKAEQIAKKLFDARARPNDHSNLVV